MTRLYQRVRKSGYGQHESRRRGVTAVVVVVSLPIIIGFAALTVDVAVLYNTRADLQRAADAGAMAAAAALTSAGFQDEDPQVRARNVAQSFVEESRVLGGQVTIDTGRDVTFGRAVYDPENNSYTYEPTDFLPDAVRVTVRKTADSPNGATGLYFARFFGKASTNIQATAIAAVAPRDMALTVDLSGSMNDDSELQHYELTDVNLYDVWSALPGGIDDEVSTWGEDEIPADPRQAAGPGWGFFKQMGFGDFDVNEDYDPRGDAGLVELRYNDDWNDNDLEAALTARGYNADEVEAIMDDRHDRSGFYDERVAIALGFADWHSGMPGGRWENLGMNEWEVGNGNTYMGGSELAWSEQFFDRSMDESQDVWEDYIDYVTSSRTRMEGANRDFRYRYGLKTFVNFLLESRNSNAQTPELSNTPSQPMEAVKDAADFMVQQFIELNTNDQVSLEVYATTSRHEVDLTPNFASIQSRLRQVQAGHYDSSTNIGAGIQEAIDELTSPRARGVSRKIIVLLTDGQANVDRWGRGSTSGGAEYARDMARAAAGQGIRVYAVSVGAGADQALMREIAEIGGGEHFHAEGTIEQYSEELERIFLDIGGRREAQLIM